MKRPGRGRLSLGEQLTLLQALTSLLLAGTAGFLLYAQLARSLRASFADRVSIATQDLAEEIAFYVAGGDGAGLRREALQRVLSRRDTAYVRVLDGRGRPLAEGVGSGGRPLQLQASWRTRVEALETRVRSDVLEVATPVLAHPLDAGGGGEEALLEWSGLSPERDPGERTQVGTLVVGYALDDLLQAQRSAISDATLVALLVLFLGLALSYLLGRSVGTSVSRVAARAERLATGELIQEPLPEEGQGELKDLARAFNIMGQAIEEREAQLREYSETLEAEVDRRTIMLREEALRLANANELLRLQNERVRAADQAKTEFLATMSHELRTPLNSIIGFSSLLLQEVQGPLNEDQREDLDVLQRAAHHLLSLINDLLDLSKVEAGRMEIRPERVDPDAFFDDLGAVAMGLPVGERVQLDLRIDPTTPPPWADPKRLHQVALNLVSNALKFTEEGRVEVRLGPGPEGCFQLEVEDTGPGIPLEKQESIFAPFSQLDQSVGRQHAGTGLGLSISRQLVLLMGGEIRLRSCPGEGSSFTVRIPSEPAEDGAEEEEERPETPAAGTRA